MINFTRQTLFCRLLKSSGASLRLLSSSSTSHRVTLIKMHPDSTDPKPFFAIIKTHPALKEHLKQALRAKGLLCMDYTGDDSKIAVGFGLTNFLDLINNAIADVDPDSNRTTPISHTP